MTKRERIGAVLFISIVYILTGIAVAALSHGMTFVEVVELLWGIIA